MKQSLDENIVTTSDYIQSHLKLSGTKGLQSRIQDTQFTKETTSLENASPPPPPKKALLKKGTVNAQKPYNMQ